MGRARMLSLVTAIVALTVAPGRAETIALDVNAYSASGTPLTSLVAGDIVIYELAVSVDSSAAGGNLGLASIVYDVSSAQAAAAG